MNQFVIPFRLPGYNEQAHEDRRNKYSGAKLRKDTEEGIVWAIRTGMGRGTCQKITKPCVIRFTWVEQNNKRDLDNIAFAKKYILDAMQQAGMLENDSQKWVRGFRDEFAPGRGDSKVAVTIEDADEDALG